MKNYSILVTLFIAMTILSMQSCMNCVEPAGEVKTESRKLDNFTKIYIAIPANIKIISGDSAKISITTSESYLTEISSDVKRGKLRLEGNICDETNGGVSIELTVPELAEISINGSANAFSDIPIRTDRLSLDINGSGYISLNVFANTIKNKITGSGEINISGTCQKLDVEIDGSGEFKGLGLNSYSANVHIAGSGKANIVALNKLIAKVAGSGEISYSGEPEVSVDISGNGKINKLN